MMMSVPIPMYMSGLLPRASGKHARPPAQGFGAAPPRPRRSRRGPLDPLAVAAGRGGGVLDHAGQVEPRDVGARAAADDVLLAVARADPVVPVAAAAVAPSAPGAATAAMSRNASAAYTSGTGPTSWLCG